MLNKISGEEGGNLKEGVRGAFCIRLFNVK